MWVCTPVVTHSKPELTGTLFNAIAMGVATTNPTISPSWIQGRVWRLGLNEYNYASIGLLAAGSGWSELQLSSMILRPWFSHIVLFHPETQTIWDVPCSKPPRLLPVHILERYANRAPTPLFYGVRTVVWIVRWSGPIQFCAEDSICATQTTMYLNRAATEKEKAAELRSKAAGHKLHSESQNKSLHLFHDTECG